MSTADVTRIYRVPGRVCVNPTAIGTFPHGGTSLGVARKFAVRMQTRQRRVEGEEYDETVETIRGGQRVVALSLILRQWDNDALSTIFPSTSTGSTGDKIVSIPGSARAGAIGSDSGVKLLIAPNDATQPGVLIYRAIPEIVDESGEDMTIAYSIFSEHVLSMRFIPIRDASNRVLQIGRLADMTL